MTYIVKSPTQPKLLFDLAFASKHFGHCGIAQETRFLFDCLSASPTINMSGLLRHSNKKYTLNYDLNSILGQSLFLGVLNYGFSSIYERIINRFSPFLYKCYVDWSENKKSKYDLFLVEKNLFFLQIWRHFFNDTLSVDSLDLISKQQYYLTRLFRFYPGSLRSDGFDFILLQSPQNIKVAKNTTKLVRYHDGIPVLDSDILTSKNDIIKHYKDVRSCEYNSIFICNSPSALQDLEKLSPKAAESAHIIPCIVPELKRTIALPAILYHIISLRISDRLQKQKQKQKSLVHRWFNNDMSTMPKFIMMISSVEPRKNYSKLIDAWLKLRHDTGENIKLLTIGSFSHNYSNILEEMRNLLFLGNFIHLEKVSQEELKFLYSSATCFVFPSFSEGFGLPPCEAMQCGCPVAVSDIPAHRYSAGDAALFFNPYDQDSIMEILKSLVIDTEENQNLRKNLIEKGYQNVQRFSNKVILNQWEELIDKLWQQKQQQ